MPLVHETVRAELNARRHGTASTKTRGQVSGGGAKPWRQKGTGRARAGSSRSPVWTGGGVVFGPSPRHYTVKVNRKARRAALRSALSLHAGRESLAVFDAAAFSEPSTAQAADLLADWGATAPTLIVLTDAEAAAGKSFRNLSYAHAIPVEDAGVADLVGAASLLVSQAAMEALVARAAGPVVARRHRGGGGLMEPTQVIIRPVLSEKTFALAEAGKYTFRVHDKAHKTQIRQAIELLFEVNVLEVRTAHVHSKPKRRGQTKGRTRQWKKAIVQVREGQTIPIFGGLEAGE